MGLGLVARQVEREVEGLGVRHMSIIGETPRAARVRCLKKGSNREPPATPEAVVDGGGGRVGAASSVIGPAPDNGAVVRLGGGV